MKFSKPDAFDISLRNSMRNLLREQGKKTRKNLILFINITIAFGLYFTPLVLLLTGVLSAVWSVLLGALVMGMGFSMLGSIQHHANHSSLSGKPWMNETFSYVMELLGMSHRNWRVQHNILHHTETNVLGKDGDLTTAEPLLKFGPFSKIRNRILRYQHIYAWFLYGLTFFSWIFIADFLRIRSYEKAGFFKGKNYSFILAELFFFKVFYLFLFFGLPLIFGVPFYLTFILWASSVFIAGLIMMPVFQAAHINEWAEQYDHNANLEDTSFFKHQIRTGVNFYFSKNRFIERIFTHFFGGLNHQVAHHVHFRASYIHYPELSEIIRNHADENDSVTYHSYSFGRVLKSHYQMLKKLGRAGAAA